MSVPRAGMRRCDQSQHAEDARAGVLEVRLTVPRFGRQFVAAGEPVPAGYFSDESDGGLSWSESPRRAAGEPFVDAAKDGAKFGSHDCERLQQLTLVDSCYHLLGVRKMLRTLCER